MSSSSSSSSSSSLSSCSSLSSLNNVRLLKNRSKRVPKHHHHQTFSLRKSSSSRSASSLLRPRSKNLNPGRLTHHLRKVISLMKPFDLLYFRGPDFVSDTIRLTQEKQQGEGAGEFSHVGMIVSSEILDDPKLKPGRMYVFESTMSGSLADGVKNVNGESFFGTQVRDIETLIKVYDRDPRTAIAWCALEESKRPIYTTPKTKRKINDLYNKLVDIRYDWNFCSLLGAAFKPFRCLARVTEKCLGTEKNLFCSELVATFYKGVGIIPPSINPANVVPSDFLGYDIDQSSEKIERCVLDPVYLTLDDDKSSKQRGGRSTHHKKVTKRSRRRHRSFSRSKRSRSYSQKKKTSRKKGKIRRNLKKRTSFSSSYSSM